MPNVGGSTSTSVSDLQFLRDKEKNGDLIHELSSEFSTDADQISYTVPNGKTFFLIKATLYPVVDTIHSLAPSSHSTWNRRADVELTFDTVVKDVLTHDHQGSAGSNSNASTGGQGNSGQAGKYETSIFESLVGDGIKQVKLTSTNTSGTYRVSLLGFLEDT